MDVLQTVKMSCPCRSSLKLDLYGICLEVAAATVSHLEVFCFRYSLATYFATPVVRNEILGMFLRTRYRRNIVLFSISSLYAFYSLYFRAIGFTMGRLDLRT